MPRLDPASLDLNRPLAMGRFNTVNGHALGVGHAITVTDQPSEKGEVDEATARRLWAGGTFVYAEEARPTPVESPQDAARRLVEVEDLGGGWYLIRAPWLEKAEKVQGKDEADKRRDELIAAGQPTEVTGTIITDAPMAGQGEGTQIPGATDAGGSPVTRAATSKDQRVQKLVDSHDAKGLRDMIEVLNKERAEAEPPLPEIEAKADHNKTDLARLIVDVDGDLTA